MPRGRLQHATPRETDALDETVQDHIKGCRACQDALTKAPAGFGQKTKFCPQYLQIVQMFADGKMLNE